MWHKTLIVSLVLFLAFSILIISVLRSAEIRYEFNPTTQVPESTNVNLSQIAYSLPYPGQVLPDSPFWILKTLRDRVWYIITTDDGKRADLLLLFADKRLNMAILLFENNKPELGFAILTKAEKYLEEASFKEIKNRQGGSDTTEFLERLSLASLKHYEVIQYIVSLAPDDARPVIFTYEDYPKKVYYNSRDALNEKGKTPPENPFNW